ncbi:alkaline phosphatase family protein [Gulosibacter sediminis]|uniref:alkaline phosphatase family protein n=1 Tax=Gulosibacter sediminis TaxID=1729695 RepID=UPI0024ADFCF5|nr:nucleotide pyrophosphatase/phosphodiesterase family protein [Gulosibacter sediminis]
MPFTLVESPGDQPLLADVLPDCLAAMGVPSPDATGRLDLPEVRGAIVILVDGLGAHQLRARSGHARTITRAWNDGTAQSFPSTTVSGITSLTTASRAGDHGMVAYSVWDREQRMYLNQLSGWGTNMPPDTWQLRDTVFETVRGASPVVVSVEDYRESGLTLASLRGADYLGAETMRDRSEVAAQAARELAHPLIYLYHAELDQTGHSQGWESDAWTVRLEELDASIDRLLELVPDDIGILLLADHGMVDVARERQRDIDDALPSDVVAVAGEPRLRHIYLPDDATDLDREVLASRLRAAEGDLAVALTRDEAIARGWYGDDVDPEVFDRIGDVVLAAVGDVSYYVRPMPASMRQMIGQHGSVTPEETTVPLVRLGAFVR